MLCSPRWGCLGSCWSAGGKSPWRTASGGKSPWRLNGPRREVSVAIERPPEGVRASNIVRVEGQVSRTERAFNLGHRSKTVWFTGLSGSGKSTLAFAVERALIDDGVAAYVLDGDNIRFGLNADLGFSPEDRTENIRRIGEVCRLFSDAGVVVLTAFISPYRADRQRVRDLHADGDFVEVFVDTPLEVCEQRDVKGLYKKARAGEIPDFSGISAPYEPPENPDIRVDTAQELDDCVRQIVNALDLAR
ncbi:MAG: adenylyl-sulfate kinase [Acidimicrobiales bacterium]|nr:adenylyl-sulfate kinase [Acidimicrobiales bacterium]